MTSLTGVNGARHGFHTLQQFDLGGIIERGNRVVGDVEGLWWLSGAQHRRQALGTRGGDGARRGSRPLQGLQADVVGIGEGGFLAGQGTHADALFDVEAARFDDAFFQAPGFGTLVLEIEVGEIDMVAEQLAEDALQLVRGQAMRAQQGLLGNLEMGNRAGDGVHGLSCGLPTVCGVSVPAGWRGCR